MRALLSVYDKTGLVEFATGLSSLGVELVSSGGTAKALSDAGLAVTTVEEVTGSPEMLDHRVVTLHPKIHGGILADLGKESHRADLEAHGITPFDLVVTNLYPFASDPGIELIDIGGPTMVRAAAKNHKWVGIITSTSQYGPVLDELTASLAEHGKSSLAEQTRRALALEAFASTAAYDAAIVEWLSVESGDDPVLPQHLDLALEKTDETLRYGENPHQRGARYRLRGTTSWWDDVTQHSGLALSYLNYYDTDAAWIQVHDLGDRPAVAIIKHANPCGVAIADDLATAYKLALACDERSAFGGIVALNRPVDDATAALMVDGPQADVVIAPGYEGETLEALKKKRKNTRISRGPAPERAGAGPEADLGWLPGPGCAVLPGRSGRVAGDDEDGADRGAVGRRGAGLADLRPREVELDRAGEGSARPSASARGSRTGSRRARSRRRRRTVARWAARARVGRVLPVPRRGRGRGFGGGRGGGAARRWDQGRADHHPRRRARPRDGVHRRTALPPLTPLMRLRRGPLGPRFGRLPAAGATCAALTFGDAP